MAAFFVGAGLSPKSRDNLDVLPNPSTVSPVPRLEELKVQDRNAKRTLLG
ncbi:hypothetical protein IWQ52_003384 [Labrenzia sp. EL_159]|nr:hypothetical protein [Labrenzia sp. EL_162]MBG6195854.1 hypothetical protein [Labrenzia sp. EL_159]